MMYMGTVLKGLPHLKKIKLTKTEKSFFQNIRMDAIHMTPECVALLKIIVEKLEQGTWTFEDYAKVYPYLRGQKDETVKDNIDIFTTLLQEKDTEELTQILGAIQRIEAQMMSAVRQVSMVGINPNSEDYYALQDLVASRLEELDYCARTGLYKDDFFLSPIYERIVQVLEQETEKVSLPEAYVLKLEKRILKFSKNALVTVGGKKKYQHDSFPRSQSKSRYERV